VAASGGREIPSRGFRLKRTGPQALISGRGDRHGALRLRPYNGSSPNASIAERSLRASGGGRMCTTVLRTARTSSMPGQHSQQPHESGRSHRRAFGVRRYARQYCRASSAWPGHRRVTSRRASAARPRGDRPGRCETAPGAVLPSARRTRMSTRTSVLDLRGIVLSGSEHATQPGMCQPERQDATQAPGKRVASALWRLRVLDSDLRFITEVHREDGQARNSLKFYRELTDADGDGR
jgi:hypothetical protein